MRLMGHGHGWLATALVATVGISLLPAAGLNAAAARPQASVALGRCWLDKSQVVLGDDNSSTYFVSWWRAGSTQTTIAGTAPQARYWSLGIYHTAHGQMQSLYDQQVAPKGGSFTIAIGGSKPAGNVTWVDPTANGGDNTGYLVYRITRPAGAPPAPPTITYTGTGLPSGCSAVLSALKSTIAAVRKAHSGKANKSIIQGGVAALWKTNSPFRTWSTGVYPARLVPITDVNRAALIGQLADPNVVYHVVTFNSDLGDMVLHGRISGISAQAPQHGLRFLSLCYYGSQAVTPLACLDDSTIKTNAKGDYVIAISSNNPTDTANVINPGSGSLGVLLMRWLLPAKGATFCLPAIDYRQPGDHSVPPLPSSC